MSKDGPLKVTEEISPFGHISHFIKLDEILYYLFKDKVKTCYI